MSSFLQLNSTDFVKGLVVTVLAAIFASLATALNLPGFDFSTFNWGEIIKIAVVSGIGYLGKNLISTSDGKVLGMGK